MTNALSVVTKLSRNSCLHVKCCEALVLMYQVSCSDPPCEEWLALATMEGALAVREGVVVEGCGDNVGLLPVLVLGVAAVVVVSGMLTGFLDEVQK